MPKLPTKNGGTAYLGVVTFAHKEDAYIEEETYREKKDVPFIPEPSCLLSLILWLSPFSFKYLYYYYPQQMRALELKYLHDNSDYILLSWGVGIYFYFFLLLLSKIKVERSFKKTRDVLYKAKFIFDVKDFSNTSSFKTFRSTIVLEEYEENISLFKNTKAGHVVVVFPSDKKTSFENLTLIDKYNSLPEFYNDILAVAYLDKNSPLVKRTYDFSKLHLDVHINENGATLGKQFRPWTAYYFGTASVMEIRSVPTRGGVAEPYVDLAIYKFGEHMNPLVIQQIYAPLVGSTQNGHVVIALMFGEQIGTIINLTTGRNHNISSKSGFGYHLAHFSLLDEPERYAAHIRLEIEKLAKAHATGIIEGNIQSDPHV